MTKSDVIVLRVEGETKRTLATAASRRGKSMSAFVIDAAVAEARRVEANPPRYESKFRGVPTFFRGNCATAAQGGAGGYRLAGWHLAHHTGRLMEYETDEERDAKAEELEQALARDDSAAVLAWYEREFPRCMELVPSRRREQFLKGVFEVAEDGFDW
jgi:hypothetical protein